MVAAVGLAATRDFVSFLRHARRTMRHSQSARRRRAHTLQLFHLAAVAHVERLPGARLQRGRRRAAASSTACSSRTGGGSGDQINYRFAQTGRTERNRQNHLYPEGVFPFAYPVLTDHLSGKTGGRNARCTASQHLSRSASRSTPPTSTGSRRVRCCTRDTRGNDLNGSGERALLPDLGLVAWRRERDQPGTRASSFSTRPARIRAHARAPGRARSVGQRRNRAAEESRSRGSRQTAVNGSDPSRAIRPASSRRRHWAGRTFPA